MAAGVRKALRRAVAAGAPGALARLDTPGGGHTCAVGLSDLATGAAMRPGLRFRIGGVAKMFTTVLVMQLVDEGRLDLDAPLHAYLPVPLPDGRVTVRGLLGHPGGVDDRTDELFAATVPGFKQARRGARSLSGFVRLRPSRLPAAGPGRHADTGFAVAGRLIEQVTGSLAERYDTRIIRPLALRDTSYAPADPGAGGPHARGYLTLDRRRGRLADATEQTVWWARCAGATVSSARDLNVFLHGLLSGRLVSGRALAAMLAMVPSDLSGSRFHGLGIRRYDLGRGPAVYGHTGTAQGYSTYAFATGDGARRLTVMANTSNNPAAVKALGRSLAAAFGDAAGESARMR